MSVKVALAQYLVEIGVAGSEDENSPLPFCESIAEAILERFDVTERLDADR